jgi:hypothetical protein
MPIKEAGRGVPKKSRQQKSPRSPSEVSLYRQGERLGDAEQRWELWAKWFKDHGSKLFRWLALLSMHETFWGRDPRIVIGYVPRRARGRKIASLANFFHALRNDTGIKQRTAYREIGYAHALIEALGKERVLALLGTRAANDDRFLRDLTRLKSETQVRDVAEIYTAGAGEKTAKKRLALWLDIQAEKTGEAKGKEESREQEQVAPSPAGLLGPKPDIQQTLLALGLRLRDVLEVVQEGIALAREDQAIQAELAELRAELEPTPLAPNLTPEPASGPLTPEEIEQIRTRIRELEALAEPLPKKSRKKTQFYKEVSRLELRLQADFMEVFMANLQDDEAE